MGGNFCPPDPHAYIDALLALPGQAPIAGARVAALLAAKRARDVDST